MLTFHKIMVGCEAGEGEAWRAFLRNYTPVVVQLARLYLPGRYEPVSLWRELLIAVCGENFKLLREFEHQSEREFLAGLRSLFLERGLENVDPGESAPGPAGPVVANLSALIKDLPLLHQQVVFFKLAGYSDRTIEQIFRITPAVAQKSLERLHDDYGAWLGREQDVCPWPGAWLALVRDARAAKTDACPPLRLFLRIQDGQVGWYEKEPAEKHVGQCLHCLEVWTALQEISYWRTAAPPASQKDLDSLIGAVPVRIASRKSAPLFKRIFG